MDLKINFFTDLCLHVNELNSGLQDRSKTIIIMFDLIKAYEAKLQIVVGHKILIFKIQKVSFLFEAEFFPEYFGTIFIIIG